MRAPLSLCLPLLALAASGCHVGTGVRAPSAQAEVAVATPDPDIAAPAPAPTPASPTAQASRPPAHAILAFLPVTAPAAEPIDASEPEIHGTIVARQGTTLTIRVEGDTAFAAGERAQLLRHFERRLGSATLDGWLDVARVTVLARDGRALDLSIDEETARVMINGRKQDQFRVGFRVRLQAT
jgi:hypothetical protein